MTSKSEQPYGQELMQRVAAHLFQGLALAHVHRDDCGIGLFCDGSGAYAAEVQDGAPGTPLIRWTSAGEFVAFFAEQSDATMERRPGSPAAFATEDPWRHGNQTLTRARFESFIDLAAAGDARRTSELAPPERPFELVLEEVLDQRQLLTFLRGTLGYQLKAAHAMLSDLPRVLFGIESEEAGADLMDQFARSGGRCSLRRR